MRIAFSTRGTSGAGADAAIHSCDSSVSPYLANRARARSFCMALRSRSGVHWMAAGGGVLVVGVRSSVAVGLDPDQH